MSQCGPYWLIHQISPAFSACNVENSHPSTWYWAPCSVCLLNSWPGNVKAWLLFTNCTLFGAKPCDSEFASVFRQSKQSTRWESCKGEITPPVWFLWSEPQWKTLLCCVIILFCSLSDHIDQLQANQCLSLHHIRYLSLMEIKSNSSEFSQAWWTCLKYLWLFTVSCSYHMKK